MVEVQVTIVRTIATARPIKRAKARASLEEVVPPGSSKRKATRRNLVLTTPEVTPITTEALTIAITITAATTIGGTARQRRVTVHVVQRIHWIVVIAGVVVAHLADTTASLPLIATGLPIEAAHLTDHLTGTAPLTVAPHTVTAHHIAPGISLLTAIVLVLWTLMLTEWPTLSQRRKKRWH